LKLHPDKTRLLPFRRSAKESKKGKGPVTFDFLGFTVHWRRNRKGGWVLGFKTRKARLRRAIVATNDWCRRHRHLPVKVQQAALTRRIQGHFNYFGVNGTFEVWCKCYMRRHGPGANGSAVGVSGRVSTGNGSRIYYGSSCSLSSESECRYGPCLHEPLQRRSRMVEISLSGSGEGPGAGQRPGLLYLGVHPEVSSQGAVPVFRKLAEQKESRVEEGHVMLDHVHMMLSIPPKLAVSHIVGYIKGKSAVHIARTYEGKQHNYVGHHF
jgi:hypothetical protein